MDYRAAGTVVELYRPAGAVEVELYRPAGAVEVERHVAVGHCRRSLLHLGRHRRLHHTVRRRQHEPVAARTLVLETDEDLGVDVVRLWKRGENDGQRLDNDGP